MKSIELFQWDLNKKIPCSFPEAHFACIGSKDALIVKTNGGNAQIPNVLLQEGKDIMFWFMEGGAVADSGRIRIITRAKPADYVYTETEVITFESLVAKVEDVIAKANTAVDNATTAAQKADEAALKANAASDKAAQVEAEIKAAEAVRKTAEQGRAEAEATRAASESKRNESFNTNLVSWNSKVDAACKKATDTASKAAQDAKTATDAAIAKTEEATNAAVAKADKATASATTAANKAEAAVAQLPVPSGNVLKGEAESTFINLHDSWKAPILKGKVLGQSNQITTTGKNLINGMESFCKASELPSSVQRYCWGYSLGQSPLKLKQPLKPGTYTYSLYCDRGATVYLSQSPYSGKNEQFVINNKLPNDKKNGLVRHYGTIQLTKESNIVGIYSDYSACCCGMLNEGTKPLPYEPYTGGKPSPSPEYPQEITNLNKAELAITGKNLINVSKEAVSSQCPTQTNGYKIENGVITFTSVSSWGADYIFFNEANVLGADKLTFSMKATKAINTSNNNGAKYLCKAFDAQGNEIVVEQGLSTKEYEWGYNNYYKAYCQLVPNHTLTIALRPNVAKIRFGVCFSDGQAGTEVEIKDFQIEAGSKATAYEPYKSKSTLIDLKGNKLCSLPNGVKDEVVIDSEGNVSLIKRLWKFQKRIGDMNNSEAYPGWKFTDNELKENVGAGIDVSINGISSHFKRFSANTLGAYDGGTLYIPQMKQSELIAKYPDVIVSFIAPKITPQTIPLGKVELPALPEATSNIWNNGNIPANVYIQYLKDVNIAYSDLENQIKQITAALSMIDTPTIIPEMAWGTPAAL